jgi:16S rRNA (guanine527-N7)-methyltransferase
MILLKNFISDELLLDPDKYLNDFILYEKLLLEWNKKINLVSRKSVSIEEHILNSIFFLSGLKLNNIRSIADIGTGGGFPGIPLKIIYPDLNVLLVDSIQKKVNVLNDIIEKMNLKDTEAVCGRAEDVSLEIEYRHKFDCVISKAVSTMENLYEWGNNFLNKDGRMLFIKGGDIEKELRELNKKKYNFNVEVVNFNYAKEYRIVDKKLTVIK